jgi:hypothetical protein
MCDRLLCEVCGDVIGAYEPMIVLAEAHARRTSRAAERAAGGPVGSCFHDSCFARAYDAGPDPDD